MGQVATLEVSQRALWIYNTMSLDGPLSVHSYAADDMNQSLCMCLCTRMHVFFIGRQFIEWVKL